MLLPFYSYLPFEANKQLTEDTSIVHKEIQKLIDLKHNIRKEQGLYKVPNPFIENCKIYYKIFLGKYKYQKSFKIR